jgi:hypothetical protein
MIRYKKLTATLAILALMGICAQKVNAAEYSTDLGGSGYAESRRAPSVAPAVALGTIALVAIVAIALQNQHHNGHNHAH